MICCLVLISSIGDSEEREAHSEHRGVRAVVQPSELPGGDGDLHGMVMV